MTLHHSDFGRAVSPTCPQAHPAPFSASENQAFRGVRGADLGIISHGGRR